MLSWLFKWCVLNLNVLLNSSYLLRFLYLIALRMMRNKILRMFDGACRWKACDVLYYCVLSSMLILNSFWVLRTKQWIFTAKFKASSLKLRSFFLKLRLNLLTSWIIEWISCFGNNWNHWLFRWSVCVSLT